MSLYEKKKKNLSSIFSLLQSRRLSDGSESKTDTERRLGVTVPSVPTSDPDGSIVGSGKGTE